LYAIAQIRLCDISDFFKKLPLCKKLYTTLSFFLNTGSFTIAYNQKAAYDTATLTTVNVNGTDNGFGSLTCPLMITSHANYRGGFNPYADVTTAKAKNVIVSVGIARVWNATQVLIAGQSPHPMSACRITVPMITMTASQELAYIEKIGREPKVVKYIDVFPSYKLGITGGNTFQQLISNGLSGVRRIIAIPFLSSTTNGVNATATTGFSTLASPFCESPGCGGDLISLTQCQVQVAGNNIVEMSSIYTYENFLEQLLLSASSGLNGNQPASYGLVSGLMDQRQWNQHRVYAFDLSRHDEDQSYLNESITFTATVNAPSTVVVDIYFFVEYTRSVSVDIQSGKVSELTN
jgi:hypothetical protein